MATKTTATETMATKKLSTELPTLRYRDGIDYPALADSVKELQQALGITIDGQFGRNTEAKVIEFQKANGLVADGVVGAVTWSALLKKPIQNPTSEQLAANSPTVEVGGRTYSIDRIVASIPTPDIRAFASATVPLILQECSKADISNPAHVAYILATAEHESGLGQWMEEFASGWEYEGRHDLGNTEPGDGPRFKGRGFVQLTGRINYADWSGRLNLDLLTHPEQVAEPAIAAQVLVVGMRDGTFTGVSLTDYLGEDFYTARKIINGLDCADRIAAIAQDYLRVL